MFDSREIAQRALLCAGLIKARRKRRWERMEIAALLLVVSALVAYFILFPVGYGGTGPPAQGSVTILDGAVAGEYAMEGFRLRAADYIVKPATAGRLRNIIHNITIHLNNTNN